MELTNHFVDMLRCPESGQSLKLHQSQLVAGDEQYPLVNDIPWLLATPHNSLMDWGMKLNYFQQILKQEIIDLSQELQTSSSVASKRIQRLIDGKKQFVQNVTELVLPVLGAKVAAKPVYDSLVDRAPSSQNLLSYEANLYRDWVWGDEENQQSLELVTGVMDTFSVSKVAVLGAGACRLAYDLCQALTPECLVATDINPMLMLGAQKVLSGESLSIVEFPQHPKSIDDIAIEQTIKGRTDTPSAMQLLFADAMKPALQEGAVDTLVTPWLIDIQPYELTRFLTALNHYLPIGGQWINFGSLVFNQNRESLCYTSDEIQQVAKDAGFEIEQVNHNTVPYLKSPHNAGYRMETVWSWRAVKTRSVELPVNPQPLPEWLIDLDEPIPSNNDISQFVYTHQTYAALAQKVDGKHSIKQIALAFANEQQVDQEEALAMLKNFYLKIYLNSL